MNMGFMDETDRMANSCFISQCTWKWIRKLFFSLLWMVMSFCLVVGRPLGRQATAINEVARLASTSNQH
jgi:hypothetical protein